ncbi:amidohydrolase family protein [Chelativorans intermedius]|uniref:Amidohydrolase family protein n=1 Tax=Chelativorans intermedius TaxID=515947 RepID=A0ABV6D5T7_9HYPH|nr:amidohydrolase family protein [Chelativorans intermedius]MCT8997524.1 amidohydrolase family protein [Chelativorans intermedius]
MSDFLIKGALGILTGRPGAAARAKSDIRVRGGVISEIGSLAALPGERIVDASGAVVTPGLINTHHHLFQSVLKAVPAGMNEALAAWLRLVPYAFWACIDEEALRVSATVGLAELALSGTTTVADHHYFFSDRYDFDPLDVLFKTAERFNLRFVLARGGATKGRAFDTDQTAPLPVERLDRMIASVETAVRRWHDPSPTAMRRVAFAPTTPTFSLYEAELKEIATAARAMGVRLHSHLSENMDYVDYTLAHYGRRPVHWLAEHGWLGPDVWFAHLVECDEGELQLLAKTGSAMAHCPQANARLGSGIAPADRLHALGGTVSLAVDGAAANEAADMISALYSAFSLHRAQKGVGAVDAETVLHWATAGGAHALGFETIGTLEPGKQADIAIFDLDAPRYFGQHDRVLGPVISGGQPRVRASFVAGRPVVENGRLPWLDMERLAADATRIVARIANKHDEGRFRATA